MGIAATGGTGWPIFLVNGFLIGLIQGFAVIFGRKFGEKDEEAFDVYYKKARSLCFIISVLFVVVLLATSGLFLRLLGTKEEVFGLARTYINVIFAGIPFLVFYQFFAAVLRSRGNSRIHLMAMTVSSICNIILDLLFICVMKMGIGGAALGTILSECLVMVICGYHVFDMNNKRRQKSQINSDEKCTAENASVRHAMGSAAVTKELITVGLPMALQSVITSIGGFIVTGCINRYDIAFVQGYYMATEVYVLLEVAASSYGMTVVSFVSQNYGAGEIQRIRSGVRASIFMGVVTALVCSFIMIMFGDTAMRLFVVGAKNPSEEIFRYGREYLLVLGIFYPFLYTLYIMRAALQGLGNTVVPMISSFGQSVMRVLCALVITGFIGYSGIYYGEITAWLLANLILVITYFWLIKRVSNSNQVGVSAEFSEGGTE